MILCVLQARVSSRRLPGKVLAPVQGRPMLARQLDRLRRARSLDALVVATSTHPSDDELAKLCEREGVACARGSLEDVLDRVWRAAEPFAPDHVVRATGDCPLADAELLDRCVHEHTAGGHDYTSNALVRTFPDGLDVEVVRQECLTTAWREARLPSEREHVTPFLYTRPERFDLHAVTGEVDRSHLRWTVDDAADLELVRAIYAELLPRDEAFGTDDVLALLERRPELVRLNAGTPTNEGYARSLARDARSTESRHE